MTLELKNIKVHLGLSEETYAYTATVHWHGKKAVEVSNSGHGGCDMQASINGARLDDINQWCIDNLPKWAAGDDMHDTDLEIWCAEQVGRHLLLKDMRKLLRTRPVFTKEGEDGLFELKFRGVKKYEDRMARIVLEKHPNATVLNTLPETAALAIYRQHAG